MATVEQFRSSLAGEEPDGFLAEPLQALWWDAKGDWRRAHGLVDELETPDGMAVHAYLHRKEGAAANASYWYRRVATRSPNESLAAEWERLVKELLRAG